MSDHPSVCTELEVQSPPPYKQNTTPHVTQHRHTNTVQPYQAASSKLHNSKAVATCWEPDI